MQFRQRCNKGSRNTVPLILNSTLIHPTAAERVNGNNSCKSSAVKDRENKLGTDWDWEQHYSGNGELFLALVLMIYCFEMSHLHSPPCISASSKNLLVHSGTSPPPLKEKKKKKRLHLFSQRGGTEPALLDSSFMKYIHFSSIIF